MTQTLLMASLWLCWLCALAVLGSSQGARILGIFPTPSISHQLPFQAVMKALAARGHQVTVISTDPLKSPHKNYVDIDLSFTYDLWDETMDELQEDTGFLAPYRLAGRIAESFSNHCNVQLTSQQMRDFLKSEQKFDLVFVEVIMSSCMFGIVHTVGSPPVIGILSLGGFTQTYEAMGSPNNPALNPDVQLPYNDHMSFLERTNNFLFWLWSNLYAVRSLRWEMEKVSRKYFGDGIPSVWESEANVSLYMLNNHWSMSYPRPLVPSVIELGSLHLQTETKPLPKDLQVFLDSATEGFIYFSLGSNVRSEKLPESKRNEFLAAFAELPQKVLWKWEADSLPGQPENVMINKWLPQQDVLAHPNCVLFITQGGLQSLNEATHNAIPLLGIPFMGDQGYNVKKIVSSGVGVQLNIEAATKGTILNAIRRVIGDPSYRENMRRLSAINKDQPETPLERAVWWTEYVLRHNGAKHLRYAALDLSWPQYFLLDVMAFLLVLLSGVGFVSWVFLRTTLRYLRNMMTPKLKEQ